MRSLKEDPDCLFRAVSGAEKAADYILDRYREKTQKQTVSETLERSLNELVYEVRDNAREVRYPALEEFGDPEHVGDTVKLNWSDAGSAVKIESLPDGRWCVESRLEGIECLTYGDSMRQALENNVCELVQKCRAQNEDTALLVGDEIRLDGKSSLSEGFLLKVDALEKQVLQSLIESGSIGSSTHTEGPIPSPQGIDSPRLPR